MQTSPSPWAKCRSPDDSTRRPARARAAEAAPRPTGRRTSRLLPPFSTRREGAEAGRRPTAAQRPRRYGWSRLARRAPQGPRRTASCVATRYSSLPRAPRPITPAKTARRLRATPRHVLRARPWPPQLPSGRARRASSRTEIPEETRCPVADPRSSRSRPSRSEHLHARARSPACAPHLELSGHTGERPSDLMYAGSQPWQPTTRFVSVDYCQHANRGCPDIADSGYLVGDRRPPAGGGIDGMPAVVPGRRPRRARGRPIRAASGLEHSSGSAADAELHICQLLAQRPYERPITSSMTSSVPAPMRFRRMSRQARSMPYSFM